MSKVFQVTLKKSHIGCTQSQRKTLEALGLKKPNSVVSMSDNAANRGQILKIQHLVAVEVKGS